MYDEVGDAATERIRDLELRLQEAEETLEAIRTGRVDALVIAGPDGDTVYTLQGADYPYRIIVEQMAEGAVTIVEDGTILYGNHRLNEMLGQPAGGLTGKSFSSFVSAEDQDVFRQLMLDPQGRRQEMKLTVDGGTKLPVYLSAGTMELEEQRVVCLVVTDLTSQKKLEEQLRQSQKMEAIGTLAGGIAHDFNNILAIIMGNAEMAIDDPAESRRNAEQILRVSKRARDLVRQILAFSRTAQTEKKPINLGPLLTETHALLRSSIPSTIDVRLDIEAEMDTIRADPSQIQQVIMNLATNAVHAMPKGEGVLTLGLTNAVFRLYDHMPDEEMGAGNYVRLTVTDTGTGMTEEVKKRIFEPFFTTKGPGKGTGMGLAVIYGIVKDHGGSIMVESSPGKGSKFTVFFPLLKLKAKDKEEEEDFTGAPRGRERVLVVDDEAGIVEMLLGILTRLGYAVTTASHGAAALEMVSKDPEAFDLIVTDQTMPDITGLQLAMELKRIRENLPIILSTGYSQAVDPQSVSEAGINALVMKPIEKAELARTIRQVLDQKSADRPSG